jgi:hypothetical protein
MLACEQTSVAAGITTMGSDRANPGAPNHNELNGAPQAQTVEQKLWPGRPLICYNHLCCFLTIRIL